MKKIIYKRLWKDRVSAAASGYLTLDSLNCVLPARKVVGVSDNRERHAFPIA